MNCRGLASVVLALTVAVIGGCGKKGGPPTYQATGTVTLDGQPVEGADVQFKIGNALSVGTTDASGKFELSTGNKPGAPVGKAQAIVQRVETAKMDVPANPTPRDMIGMNEKKAENKTGMQTESAGLKNTIPEKYTKFGTSGLSYEVSKDKTKNDFKIELSSK